jgi:hypothetical protein
VTYPALYVSYVIQEVKCRLMALEVNLLTLKKNYIYEFPLTYSIYEQNKTRFLKEKKHLKNDR